MPKKESETKVILTDKERADLINAIAKLTVTAPGFNSPVLSEDETKIIDFLKTI